MIRALKNHLFELKKTFSLSGIITGFVVVLVGMTSSAIIVFQAARALGLGPEDASSWLGSLCLAMGILSVLLSIHYKSPVLMAWSTPGAAILVTGLKGVSYSEAVGAFLFSALLIFLCGITGLFEKLLTKIPLSLASALLGGVLLHFALDSFSAFKTQPLLIGSMFFCYILSKRFAPRSSMMIVLLAGFLVSAYSNLFQFGSIEVSLTKFHFVAPSFSLPVLLGVGLPLFIVTMASQNLTGVTVMRAHHFHVPISPLITLSGLGNMIIAPFGGFALNLAAITAAIAMGPEAHEIPEKRYFAGVISGVLYIVIGLFAGTITSLFAAFPDEMIAGVAGMALFGTIANCLSRALHDDKHKEAAFITFALTASGLSLFGIASAFWGLMAGGLTQFILVTPLEKLHSTPK